MEIVPLKHIPIKADVDLESWRSNLLRCQNNYGCVWYLGTRDLKLVLNANMAEWVRAETWNEQVYITC